MVEIKIQIREDAAMGERGGVSVKFSAAVPGGSRAETMAAHALMDGIKMISTAVLPELFDADPRDTQITQKVQRFPNGIPKDHPLYPKG